MAYASKAGRAQTSTRNPRAFGVCDRCGIWHNHDRLQWQYQWGGASLYNKRILVCDICLDVPQQQLRAIIVPADPTPIMNPRTEPYAYDETNTRITQGNTVNTQTGITIQGGNTRVTQNNEDRVTQQTGGTTADRSQQPGLDQNAVMPLQTNGTSVNAYYVTLPLVSVISNGAGLVTVTCSSAHGLSTNAQISVEGLSQPTASGFYSITVTTGTAFTYQVNPVLSAGSLLTSTTKMVTARAGLPYNTDQIPQTGPL
jgi:hypothetical protein